MVLDTGEASSLWYKNATFLAHQHEERQATDGPQHVVVLERQACFWTRWVSAAFLHRYLMAAGQAPFVPLSREQRAELLDGLLNQ